MDSTEFRLRDELGAANARIEELQRKLAAAEHAGVLAQHAAVLAEREACAEALRVKAKEAEDASDFIRQAIDDPGSLIARK